MSLEEHACKKEEAEGRKEVRKMSNYLHCHYYILVVVVVPK